MILLISLPLSLRHLKVLLDLELRAASVASQGMFLSATSFNSDVNAWNVASVTSMGVRNSACCACIATHFWHVVLLISV